MSSSNVMHYRMSLVMGDFVGIPRETLKAEWMRNRTTQYWVARYGTLRQADRIRNSLYQEITTAGRLLGEPIPADLLSPTTSGADLVAVADTLRREIGLRAQRAVIRRAELARRTSARVRASAVRSRRSRPVAPVAPPRPPPGRPSVGLSEMALRQSDAVRIPMRPPLHNVIMGKITFINQRVFVPSSDVNLLFRAIRRRIIRARTMGMSDQSAVGITFVFRLDNGNHMSKQFHFRIACWERFKAEYRTWTETNAVNQPNYEYNIANLVVSFIQENRGGCRATPLKEKTSTALFYHTKSGNNNCLFTCLKKLGLLEVDRVGQVYANTIRRRYGLPDNDAIPLSIAKKIVADLCTGSVDVVDGIANSTVFLGSAKAIRLSEGHYTIAEARIKKQCPACMTKYYTTHRCDPNRVRFADRLKNNGKRSLLCRKVQTEPINHAVLVHYDIETYVNQAGEHTPYIVGVCHRGEYSMHAGRECMVNFILWVQSLQYPVILNAFNGAKFDAYPLYSALLSMGLQVKDFIISNNSLIRLKYGNFRIFDTCKHTVGSLKSNLKAFGCATQKGDFDHSKATEWELMGFDLREECAKYLRADVMGLCELYETINGTIHGEYGTNITNFISTSQLTFALYKEQIRTKYYISLPTLETEDFYRRAICGGRTYPTRRRYISENYVDYVNMAVAFDEIKDYCIDADVVSLYPASMGSNLYPVGEEKKLEPRHCEQEFKAYDSAGFASQMPGALGIYEVSYETNKTLAHAVVGRRQADGCLEWNLKDAERVCHSSVAIMDMLDCGYTIKVHSGYYWDKAEYIFKDYIDKLFKQKETLASEGKKGSAEYQLSKLLMNGLYGKCIQRPIHTKTKSIYTNHEFWEFWGEHVVESITEVGSGHHVSGTPRDYFKKEASITKPSHLGVFILDYSRRIMLGYFKQANPHFDRGLSGGSVDDQASNDMYYTDTDSIQMHITSARRIPNLGGTCLGDIQDDLGEGCKIIRGIFVAPKLYMLEYIRRGDPPGHINYHFRGKGLNKEQLSAEIFEQLDDGYIIRNTREFQMKRIGVARNSKQREHGQFSILHETHLTKFVNANKWEGRLWLADGNSSIPHDASR